MKTTSLSSVEEESEQCQWENCGGGRYCEKHSLESKGVSLPSVEEVVSHLPMFPDAEILMEDQLIDYDKYKVGEIATLLTQDRNQAYTRLVKGIEGMMKEFVPAKNIQIGGMESDVWKLVPKEDGMYCLNCERFIHEEGCTCGMASLTDILENVVKPLYGKK